MSKAKAASGEKVPARVEVVEEALPEWFLPEAGETAYEVGGEIATGGGLPFLSCANPKAGQAGGRTPWSVLQDAGCAVGDLFASGGALDVPARVAGVPLLLLRSVRIAYRVGEGFRPEGTRRIRDQREAAPDERQALDALVLVLAPEPFLATYRERLAVQIGNRSTVVGVWADRLSKAPADKLPPWARLAARICSEPKVSKKTGQTYYAERVAVAPLTAPEVQRLATWLGGPGRDSRDAVRDWESRFRGAPGSEEPSAEALSDLPF